MRVVTEYGPDGITLARTVDDDGDGFATVAVWSAGQVVSSERVPFVPDPLPVPSVEDRLHVLLDALAVAGSLDEVRDAARQAAEGL